MRTIKSFHLNHPEKFKEQLWLWSRKGQEVAWLDSNAHTSKNGNFEALLALDAFTAIKTDALNGFDKLAEYQQSTQDWIFGYLSYELKNDVEQLSSNNYDALHFADLYFFQPQKIISIQGNSVNFFYLRMVDEEIEADFKEISTLKTASEKSNSTAKNITIEARISKEQYLTKIEKMQAYIQRGDIYEANFCQEFYTENCILKPEAVFEELNSISAAPFAAFLKLEQNYLMCASPERFLKKTEDQLISQPIKGTAARSENKEEDQEVARRLREDPKEISENVMIVDLVRNDLSKIAKKGSVNVEELCQLYSFKQVHQLISTISAKLETEIPTVEALRATFPMGSMTGAPKISAMQIIEELEETRRGLYSGAVGYFTPQGDFDFNVVIRSVLYNAQNKYASFSVGSAITAKSVPQKEYEECLLKAKAMREALSADF